jgi:hypothetical protein
MIDEGQHAIRVFEGVIAITDEHAGSCPRYF